MRFGSWVRAHPVLTLAASILAAGVLGTWWASPLLFIALVGLALVAWVPRLGPAILGRIGWHALPIVGSLRGFKASGAIITAAVGIVIVGVVFGPRVPTPMASADVAGAAARATQISRSTSAVATLSPSADAQASSPSPSPATPTVAATQSTSPSPSSTPAPTPTSAPVTTAAPAASAATPSTAPPTQAPKSPPATSQPTNPPPAAAQLVITRLNFDGAVPTSEADEFVEITNRGGSDQRMAGWRIVSVRAGQTYSFSAGTTIASDQTCRVYTNQVHPEWCGLNWGRGSAVWNNAGDRANLVGPDGTVVSSVGYGTYR